MTKPNRQDLREETLREKTLLETNSHRFVEYEVQRRDGLVVKHQTVVIRPTAIAVIIDRTLRRVLMQYRHRHSDPNLGYEFLGGGIEDDEEPVDAAAREAEEESGLRPTGNYVEFPSFEVLPGCVRSRVHSFMWTTATQVYPVHERTENSELVWISLEELPDLIFEEMLPAGPTIAVAGMLIQRAKAERNSVQSRQCNSRFPSGG